MRTRNAAEAFDKRAGTLVTLVDTADHPAQLLAHLPSEKPRRIESFNDAVLAGVALGRHEEQWFRGALGDEVQMWLVYPPGFDAKKKYPLLHVIHGGPHTAFGDSWHFRWNHQVMANQGQVVACVNYHGSSSFGQAFKDSITGRWGQLELQDVEAGTDWLLQQRWVDAKRITATGGSYGGFLVAWMNGHVPAWLARRDFQLVAVADPDPERRAHAPHPVTEGTARRRRGRTAGLHELQAAQAAARGGAPLRRALRAGRAPVPARRRRPRCPRAARPGRRRRSRSGPSACRPAQSPSRHRPSA
jgi:dienelactone hydrolase